MLSGRLIRVTEHLFALRAEADFNILGSTMSGTNRLSEVGAEPTMVSETLSRIGTFRRLLSSPPLLN
ncbi:hypothetical protein A2U01_0006809 [Trifolium medium]|uniref:Uncharacterized protein n=1 Tax=Trifolium medium TaxID=97028 RepID=A0A392MEP8_9FABA|nr:hypothetical protein [Trifolium medium]